MIALAVLSLPVAVSCVCAQSVVLGSHLYHEPVITAGAGTDVTIRLKTEAGVADIAESQLLWRNAGGEFQTSDLTPDGQDLIFTIPGESVKAPYLEYVILVRFADNQQVSYPLSEPLTHPQIIAVQQTEPNRSNAGPSFIVLYPQEGDLLYSDTLTIALSIFAPDSAFNPNSIEIIADGKTFHPLQASSTFLLIELTDLKSGKHDLMVRTRNYNGQNNPDFTCSFSTTASGGKRPVATFSWAFTGEGIVENFNGETDGILRGDFRAEGDFKNINYNARVYKTSEEAWDRQPQDRYLIGLHNDRFYLNLGDASPNFSDLVLSGRRVRGIDFGVRLGGFHLSGTAGEITKPIEGQVYRRNLIGLRPYLVTSSGGRFGFSFLKVKDSINSISAALVAPKDNVVAGFDALQPLFSQRLELALQIAFSLTAMDITGGTISQAALDSLEAKGGFNVPFDPKPWEPVIVVNESLTPPNPLSGSSIAWMGSATLREFGQLLSLSYRNIGPSYYTLGNPYLQNDLAGWNLTDQFDLWNRRLFFSLGLNQQRDNLRNTKPATTTLQGGWLTVAIYPAQPAPTLSFSLNYHTNGNNIDRVDTTFTGTDSLYFDQRRKEKSITFSGSLQQYLNVLDRRHTVTLNLNQSNYTDEIDNRPPDYANLNSKNTNVGLSWKTDLSRKLSIIGLYSYYSSESGLSAFKYQQFGADVSTRYLKRKLQIILGANRRLGEDLFSRWQASFRTDWEFYPKHSIRLDANHYFNDSTVDEGIYRIYYYKRFN